MTILLYAHYPFSQKYGAMTRRAVKTCNARRVGAACWLHFGLLYIFLEPRMARRENKGIQLMAAS